MDRQTNIPIDNILPWAIKAGGGVGGGEGKNYDFDKKPYMVKLSNISAY